MKVTRCFGLDRKHRTTWLFACSCFGMVYISGENFKYVSIIIIVFNDYFEINEVKPYIRIGRLSCQ